MVGLELSFSCPNPTPATISPRAPAASGSGAQRGLVACTADGRTPDMIPSLTRYLNTPED
ncbi:hypothetical protein GCM10017083_05300 [Thalassobaculum fulvum]|uniref:Uncharacterized protein n=1 Tax=Thalassobaculum fulvum TaxID=1633335 RepID=A0A919CNB7_9PROT|nr:hypothetical protein GCM10017083_05300 [Thalassobaculum fulvum]